MLPLEQPRCPAAGRDLRVGVGELSTPPGGEESFALGRNQRLNCVGRRRRVRPGYAAVEIVVFVVHVVAIMVWW